jgi:hypothetical protein
VSYLMPIQQSKCCSKEPGRRYSLIALKQSENLSVLHYAFVQLFINLEFTTMEYWVGCSTQVAVFSSDILRGVLHYVISFLQWPYLLLFNIDNKLNSSNFCWYIWKFPILRRTKTGMFKNVCFTACKWPVIIFIF